MNIGIRAHDMGKLPLEKLVGKISGRNFSGVQLALSKAIDGVNSDLGALNPGMAHYIGQAFRRNNIQIAVLGCYFNPMAADVLERERTMDRFKEHLRYARDFGCSIVATETGSLNEDFSFHPDNNKEETLARVIEAFKELTQEAEKFGVFVGVEGVIRHIINTPRKMKRLLDTIASNNVQVVFDPVNYLDINNYQKQEEIMKEAMELFGDRIVIVHAKDFVVEDNELKVVAPGMGLLNYELLLSLLKYRKPHLNFVMEEIGEEYMGSSRIFLQNLYTKL